MLLENRVEGVAELLAQFPQEVPAYFASASVLDQIAGFHLHRGVLALGSRIEERDAAALLGSLGQTALIGVCCGISNHDNIGSIFRNAAAFG